MKNYLLLLTLIFFSVGLFSQQFCGRDSVVVIEEIIVLNDATKNKARTDIATLAFEATPNTKYAVDQYKEVYAKVTEYFLKYRLTDDDMIASAKFMIPGASDEIFVRITENKSLNPDKVRFVTENGKEYKGVYNGKDGWTLTVLGSDANDGQSLYVVQEEEPDKFATLAKLNIFSYEPKTVKVALVPVNGFTNGFTKASVEQQLNAIYNKVGITCQVEIKDSFDYEPLKTKTFDVTGSGFFSTLTADMKAINNAYMQSSGYKEDVITLFIIEKVTGNENIAGDMPRGKQFGYLFKGATSQTIAHEIGHGIFHLDHPFARANAARSFDNNDLTDNLMQYHNGTNLVKLQWDAIHSPGLVIGIFERDEDAMIVRPWFDTVVEKNIYGEYRVVDGFASEDRKKEFNICFITLITQCDLFKLVFNQLFESEETYSIFQDKIRHFDADGTYRSSTRQLQFYSNSNISLGTVFEEFFHAGQHDYYGDTKYKNKSSLSKEFEAKVAQIYSAHQVNNIELLDDAVFKTTSSSDMDIIANSLQGEKVNASELTNAYKNLQQNIITLYPQIPNNEPLINNVNQSLEYLKSLINKLQ